MPKTRTIQVDVLARVEGEGSLDVKFAGDRVIARNIPIDALSFHLVTDGRSLRVEPLQARIANGDLALRALLSGTAQPVDASVEVTIRGMELRRFISQFSLATTALGKADGRIKLDGRGNSIAEILGSADGRMALLMTGGQIDVTDDLTVDGPGANRLTLSGENANRVFSIAGGTTDVEIRNLTIANGRATDATATGSFGAVTLGGGRIRVRLSGPAPRCGSRAIPLSAGGRWSC